MNTAVVDANVFIHGRGSYPFNKAMTVQEVVDELESYHGKNMLQNVQYEVERPSEKTVENISDKSKQLNSPTSEVDEKLLALAMDENLIILTDDFALQNLALHLDLEVKGFLEDKVEVKYKWKNICRNCGKEVSGERCSCGSTDQRRKQVRCS